MRKLLITLLVFLLCVLLGYAAVKGISISNFKVFSFKQIKEANNNLDEKINEANALTSVEYPKKLSDLKSTSKKLVTVREQYEDRITYSSEEDIQKAKQLTEFEVDFLFAKLGTYVRKEGVKINITYTPDSTGESGTIHFIVTGKYIPITEFVRDTEDDESLYFAIENFILVPGENTEELRAEFDVNAIKLNADQSIINPNIIYNTVEDTQTTTNNKNSNNANNNNTNNSANSNSNNTNNSNTNNSINNNTTSDNSINNSTNSNDVNG